MLDELKEIFINNQDKRVCVVGTTCTGKSTIINELKIGKDMDDEIFPLLSKEEKDIVMSDPWTEEIGVYMDNLVRNKLKIAPGCPLFGTVILDCDLLVYLHINDELLKNRCDMRGVNFSNAVAMQKKIEEEINSSSYKVIIVEV